ncbi:MAG: tetratricopeptide repeat protein, partial [Phycisphaerae bacterium]
DEASFGKDHSNVASCLNNLAMLYKNTNRFAEAEPLMKRALAIGEASLGKDHPDVATRLNNLAELYRATNRLAEAEPMYNRALAIYEASFGKDHPNVAITLNNLALLYQDTNRPAQAEPLMRRVVVILFKFTVRTGHPHPHLDATIDSYANLLIQMGLSQEQAVAKIDELGCKLGLPGFRQGQEETSTERGTSWWKRLFGKKSKPY